jgi:hypothetical protein
MIRRLRVAWPEMLKDLKTIDIGNSTGYISIEELKRLFDDYKIFI